MFVHQLRWWNLQNFIKVLVGGYGAGKTLILCKRVVASALTNAPCTVAVVSPSFSVARRTTIATIAELLQGKRSIYGKRFYWRWNATAHEFIIRWRGRTATIAVYSGDNPLSLRGPNLGAAYIDEPFIQEQEVYNQMLARVRHPDAIMPEICCAGTPEQLNWGYDLCVGEEASRQDVGFIQASTRMNAVLDPAYIKRLENAFSTQEASAYIDGAFKNLGAGLVYHTFDLTANVADNSVVPDYAELGAGMDFNVDPMSAVVFYKWRNRMHVVDEIELPNADTELMCEVLRERYGQKLQTIYPDATGSARSTSAPAGKSDFSYIEKAGFAIDASHDNPKRRDRYNAVNGKLKSRSGEVTLTLSRDCKKLMKYMSTYSYELIAKQRHMSHLLDALGYPVARLFPVDRESLRVERLRGT